MGIKKWIFRRFWGSKKFFTILGKFKGWSDPALRKNLQNMAKTPICKKSLRAGLGPKVDPPKKKSTFQKKNFFLFKTIKKWIFSRFWGSKNFFPVLEKFERWS